METRKMSLLGSPNKKTTRSRKRRERRKRKQLLRNNSTSNSIVEDLPKNETVICPMPGEIPLNKWNNTLDQTVTLLEDESSISNVNSTIIIQNESVEALNPNPILMDLSKDVFESEEVIDLTVNTCKSTSKPNPADTTVIDLSEDDCTILHSNVKSNINDDVLVIGTFSKVPSPKKCHKFSRRMSLSQLTSLSNRYTVNKLSCGTPTKKSVEKKLHSKKKLQRKHRKKILSAHNEAKKEYEPCCGTALPKSSLANVGENIYTNVPVIFPPGGLRPIVIDGSNVAHVNTRKAFSVKRLEICIKYFKEKGHTVTAFVPQFRLQHNKNDNPRLLRKLVDKGDVILTPSKIVDGKCIVPYDDRYIVQAAVLKGGIIVTRDNYSDLLKENPAWAETIKYRTLAFTWVDDFLMFPKDPLGEHGPCLEKFLRFS